MRLFAGVMVLAMLCGCNSYRLRYAADPQPRGAHIFVDYTRLQDAVGFSIDTDGRRLEEIYVRKGDGAILRPINIAYPGFARRAAIGTGIGVGLGHVGLGTGVGVPIGDERAQGLTTATFQDGAIGVPPWELHVKLQGIEEAVVPVK